MKDTAKNTVKWTTILTLTYLATTPAWAADTNKQIPVRTLSIDSGYIPPFTTSRAANNLWLEYEYLGTGIFDVVSANTFIGGNFLTRFAWRFTTLLGWSYFSYNGFVTNHEMGHGARFAAVGSSPTYTWQNTSLHHPLGVTFLAMGIFRFGSGAYATGGVPASAPSEWSIVVPAGGMNNSMMAAENFENEIRYNTGHINHLSAYVLAKFDPYIYAISSLRGVSGPGGGNDVDSVMASWNSKGYGIEQSDFKRGSLLSFATSFSALSLLWAHLRYVAVGDPNVRPLSIGNLVLPDTSFFLNRNGISLRSTFAYGSGNTYYPMSVEYIYKGKPTAEVSLGIKTLTPMARVLKTGSLLQGYLSSNLGGGIRYVKDLPINESWFGTLGAGLFHLNSLEAERTIGRALGTSVGAELWGRVSYTY